MVFGKRSGTFAINVYSVWHRRLLSLPSTSTPFAINVYSLCHRRLLSLPSCLLGLPSESTWFAICVYLVCHLRLLPLPSTSTLFAITPSPEGVLWRVCRRFRVKTILISIKKSPTLCKRGFLNIYLT